MVPLPCDPRLNLSNKIQAKRCQRFSLVPERATQGFGRARQKRETNASREPGLAGTVGRTARVPPPRGSVKKGEVLLGVLRR